VVQNPTATWAWTRCPGVSSGFVQGIEMTYPERRDVTRLGGASARSKFGAPVFKPEVFRKHMQAIY